MDPQQISLNADTPPQELGTVVPANAERYLTLLAEGMAANVPHCDPVGYEAFRANVTNISRRMPDRISDEEKLACIRALLREFETYRGMAEKTISDRQASWRVLVATMLEELFTSLGMAISSPSARPIVEPIERLNTATEIDNYCHALRAFLHPQHSADAAADGTLHADSKMPSNDAVGLPGRSDAVKYLSRVMEDEQQGFVVFFYLSCLDVIGERFSIAAVEDCLMAVSSYLTQCLQNDDRIFHWSDSSLLAILLNRPSQRIVTVELQRMANQNRDITINVNGRLVMLRIPLTFELTPIQQLKSADEICRFPCKPPLQRGGR